MSESNTTPQVFLEALERQKERGEVRHMGALPEKAQQALLQDAATRDRTTARRACLVRVLWFERYLTRSGLVARLEGELGSGCFGKGAWKDTFYRDMRAVKQAFKAAGYELAYSRSRSRPGYYLRGQPGLHPDLARALDGSLAEVDSAQIEIYRRLGPAARFRQGCSISDLAHQVATFCLHQRRPEISLTEASRLTRSRLRG